MSVAQWFPGHMAKAIRLIEDNLKAVDFVIECRDARAPISTRNPLLAKTFQNKKRLILLTKKDLASLERTSQIMKTLEDEGHVVLLVDVHKDNIKRLVLEKTAEIMKEKHDRDKRRGIRSRASRAMIVGVPNVGKSTVINRLASRKAVRAENRPGVTQSLTLVKVSEALEIVDTPGLLWPKFETESMGIINALVGSIKETGFSLEVISDTARDYLIEHNPNSLQTRYSITTFDSFYESVGKSMGWLVSGGEVDDVFVRRMFLKDVQNGTLGMITWD
ncbi:ribosome biogenesis GTPase YlqF [Erysipelothrix larvae]|uniref:Ribosome biogenesis GTPase A n=1 Tax=Erysipelothrix larvae TaxID=1514105 RepID=A0A0X8H0A3_9FIRM|nr:ribosome biogenesis GTPase YlqF [Erysipelothrix larvae]AMC93509.1 ribosome biogenesis GTPase YlqF [Erysipelothrix larvae]